MSDTIVFTPLPTAAVPSPTSVTFTPINNMTVIVGTLKRSLDQVVVDRADLSYIRDRGLTVQEVVVVGTDTFSSQSSAAAQLLKLAQMQGAVCAITSTEFGNVTGAICTDNGSPQIFSCPSPGYYINYRMTFNVAST